EAVSWIGGSGSLQGLGGLAILPVRGWRGTPRLAAGGCRGGAPIPRPPALCDRVFELIADRLGPPAFLLAEMWHLPALGAAIVGRTIIQHRRAGRMATASLGSVLHHLRRLAGTPRAGEPTDAQLLQRFARQRDEAAFALLVQRHGPMVLGVCRRV